MKDSEFWTLEQSAVIADFWKQWLDAAEVGDERAGEFLEVFGPWAEHELAKRPRS